MKYKCEFPDCTYKTDNRTQIHNHHIIPKEIDGNNHNSNRIWLCPNCHAKIYVPEVKRGIHSFNTENSIIINSKLNSTAGKVLEYVVHKEIKYHFYNT